jgi:hypothetical protein
MLKGKCLFFVCIQNFSLFFSLFCFVLQSPLFFHRDNPQRGTLLCDVIQDFSANLIDIKCLNQPFSLHLLVSLQETSRL